MPFVTIGLVLFFSISINSYFSKNNYGVEFFVESEPEQAIVYVKARGNLALNEKDALVREVEEIVLAHPGIKSVFAFAGAGGLNSNTSGAAPPEDTIGQIQLETIPWADRADNPKLDGNVVMTELGEQFSKLYGFETEILELARGPASSNDISSRR